MASIIFPATLTLLFLILYSPFSLAHPDEIFDTDGDQLKDGGQYYIVPQSNGIPVNGLALTPKSKDEPCPLYITLEKDESSLGIPVTIKCPIDLKYIFPFAPVKITFQNTPNICMRPLEWQVLNDTGSSYVATGSDGQAEYDPSVLFGIDHDKNGEGMYKIYHCPAWDVPSQKCDEVGIFESNGLLGITKEVPLPVKFKKASKVPTESASQI